MYATPESVKSPDEVRRFNRFMRIDASAHRIYMHIHKIRKTRGVNWSGSTKTSMATAYALCSYLHADGEGAINEEVVDILENYFGSKT